MSRRRLRRLIPIDCSAAGLILPRRDAAARDGRIAAIVGLEGGVGAAGSADAADVGLALRKAVKAAVGAASGVAGTPCSVGAGMRAGDGHCGQTDRGGEYDSPHGIIIHAFRPCLCLPFCPICQKGSQVLTVMLPVWSRPPVPARAGLPSAYSARLPAASGDRPTPQSRAWSHRHWLCGVKAVWRKPCALKPCSPAATQHPWNQLLN